MLTLSFLVLLASLPYISSQLCFNASAPSCNGTAELEDALSIADCCSAPLQAPRWYQDNNTCSECTNVVVGFEEASVEVVESVGSVSLCVRLSSAELPPLVDHFFLTATTLQQTARRRSDYIPIIHQRVGPFNLSMSRHCLSVSVVDDVLSERTPEVFMVELRRYSEEDYFLDIDSSIAEITILDNDYEFGFERTLYPVREGVSAVEVCVVSRGPVLQESVSVEVITIEGSAKVGADFVLAVVKLDFSAGGNRVCMSISLLDDTKAERRKYFYPVLTRLGLRPGIYLFPDITNIIVEDNDVGFVFGFTASRVHVSEGAGTVEVCVEQKGGGVVPSTVTITLCTLRDDAIVSGDYMSIVTDLHFTSSQGSAPLCASVPILDDHLPERAKEFSVVAVTNVDNVLLDPFKTTVTILDDDAPPTAPGDSCPAGTALLLTQHSETVDTVVDLIQTAAAPGLFAPPPDPDNDTPILTSLYNSLVNSSGTRPTDAGLNRFITGVNEITALYSEVCSEAPPTLEDVPAIARSFNASFQRSGGEGVVTRLRTDFAKMLCISDNLEDSRRRRRRRRQEGVCDIFSGDCPLSEYCSRPRSECSCPEEGITSPMVLCPCEFFDCLDQGDMIGPVFLGFPVFACLAFVVDTTGSMQDEIVLTQQVIRDFLASEEESNCYMLFPFNDVNSDPGASIGPAEIVTVIDENQGPGDLQRLITALDNIFQPESGGDCPEFSYHAINESFFVLDPIFQTVVLQPGSQMIVLTDAPAKLGITAQQVISAAQAQSTCVHFFLGESSYNCFADEPGSVEEYGEIARATGGTVTSSEFQFASFVQSYNRGMPCQHLATSTRRRRKRRNVVEEASCRVFRVSTLARLLKLSAMTNQNSVVITRPDGTETKVGVVNPLAVGDHVAMFSEPRPLAGEWAVCVEEGQVTVMVDVEVNIDATPLYVVQDAASGERATTATPPPGCTDVTIGFLSTVTDSILSAQFFLVGPDDDLTTSPSPLNHCGRGFTGNHTLPPTGTYFYQLEGEDTDLNPFSFLVPLSIVLGSGIEFYSFERIGNGIVEGTTTDFILLSFHLRGNNPYGPTFFQFSVGELPGFSHRIQPAGGVVERGGEVNVTVALRTSASGVTSGSTFTVPVSASNGCASLTASTDVIIIIPTHPPLTPPPPEACQPPCENGGTCVILTRGGVDFPICRCRPGFLGGACQFPS